MKPTPMRWYCLDCRVELTGRTAMDHPHGGRVFQHTDATNKIAGEACRAVSPRPLDFATAIPAMVEWMQRAIPLMVRGSLWTEVEGVEWHVERSKLIEEARSLLASAGIEWRET